MAYLKDKWNIIIRTKGENLEMLADAFYSVAAQTYQKRSVILAIHNATKEDKGKVLDLVKKMEPIIEIKTVEVKGGLRGRPLNEALKKCDGRYISFLDYDDVYYPNFGEILIKELTHDLYNFAYGNSIQVTQSRVDNVLGERYYYNTNKYRIYGEKFNRLLINMDNFIPLNTFIFTKELLGELNFDEELYVLEDWDFLIQLSFKEEFRPRYIDQHVSEYRIRNDGTNSHTEDPEVQKRWEESRKHIRDKNASREVTYLVKEIHELANEVIKYKHAVSILNLEKDLLEKKLSLYRSGPLYIGLKALNRFPRVKNFIKRLR